MSVRVLIYFKSRLLEDRGTPLRVRNITATLARRPDTAVKLISADDSRAIEANLGLAHSQLARGRELDQLERHVREFWPNVVYGINKADREMKAIARRSPSRPLLVLDIHGDLAAERLETEGRPLYRRWWGWARARLEQRAFFPYMDGFTTVGHALAERFRHFGKPTEVVWGGVDPGRFAVAQREPAECLRLAYAGNYRPYQGVRYLVGAAEQLKMRGEPFHLTLIGNIDEYPELKESARQRLGEHLTMFGQVPYARVPELLGHADVLVVPRSPGRAAAFNYPSKLSEYLAMGKPVVVTDVGEAGRVVEHMRTGIIVPPDDVDSLAQAFIQLKDEQLRLAMGRAGRAFAESQLAWPILGDKLVDFFDQLAGRAKGRSLGQ
jgi:glycosyltransferase involved in cell wall biosynthesis